MVVGPQGIRRLAGPQGGAPRGAFTARHATVERKDPYNAARVVAWVVLAHPCTWSVAWLCKGVYDPAIGRIR